MVQLIPLPLTVSCFSKIQIGFPFWYWLTRVVLDKGPLNGVLLLLLLLFIYTFVKLKRLKQDLP